MDDDRTSPTEHQERHYDTQSLGSHSLTFFVRLAFSDVCKLLLD